MERYITENGEICKTFIRGNRIWIVKKGGNFNIDIYYNWNLIDDVIYYKKYYNRNVDGIYKDIIPLGSGLIVKLVVNQFISSGYVFFNTTAGGI